MRNNAMYKIYLTLILSTLMFQTQAEVLPKNSPERKQLVAMGYVLDKEDAEDVWTIAKLGSTRIVFSKNNERLAVTRWFTREKKLNSTEELELLKIINSWNKEYAVQFWMDDETIVASTYIYGEHDPRAFALVVRMVDKIENVFETNPRFYKLVNK